MSLVENSVAMIEEREKEITAIVQSISEINEMYRDLATMVVDQVGWQYLAVVLVTVSRRYLLIMLYCLNAVGYNTGSNWLQHWADGPQGLQGSRGTGESRETPKEVHQTDHHPSASCPHCPGYSGTRHLPSSQTYNLVDLKVSKMLALLFLREMCSCLV